MRCQIWAWTEQESTFARYKARSLARLSGVAARPRSAISTMTLSRASALCATSPQGHRIASAHGAGRVSHRVRMRKGFAGFFAFVRMGLVQV